MKIKHDSEGPRTVHECDDCKPQHTPTPWSFEQSSTNGEIDGKALWLVSGEEPDDESVFLLKKAGHGGLEQARIDAAFIVRAVNCHEELLNVAILAFANLQSRSETNKKWSIHDQKTFEKLQQAIAKAEGK